MSKEKNKPEGLGTPPEPSLFASLTPFLALSLLLPLSVVVFHCTIAVLQFLCSPLFHGPILSGWSTILWFLVLLIVTLWGFLGQCHCVGGGVLLVLFGCKLLACS